MDNELLRRLMQTFTEELNEHVVELNSGLLALEKATTAQERVDPLKSLFRAAHSLKGAAGSVNADAIKNACHHLETLLTAVRDQRMEFTPEQFALLFKTVDAIEEAGMQLRDEQDLAATTLEGLLAELAHAAHNPADVKSKPVAGPPREAAAKSSAPAQELAAPKAAKPAAAPVSTAPASPAKPEPAKQQSAPTASIASASVRVPAEKLDSLLAQSGELLVARRRMEFRVAAVLALREQLATWKNEWRSVERPLRQLLEPAGKPGPLPRRHAAVLKQTGDRLRRLEKDLEQHVGQLVSGGRLLAQTCQSLDEAVHRVRMLPFAEACGGLERAARDLARASGKQVQLIIEGDDVEMDRSVLEGLKDPLLHLVRNAVDHGIEPAAERSAAGKPAAGTITVSAALRGGQVEICVADDGRGLNLDKIREKLKQKDFPEPQDERDLARMIFTPGFSTAAIITDVSGRGVGLDVVLSKIESLHGAVDLSFEPRQGTRLTMTVPLTLTTIRTVLVGAGGQTLAIATANVLQLVRFSADDVRQVSGRDVLLLGEAPLPIASLAETLGLPQPSDDDAVHGASDKLHGVILTLGDQRVVFIVDEVQSEQEVVVKNLGARIRRVPHIAAATLLPSGQVALVVNAPQLVRTALNRAAAIAVRSRVAAAAAPEKKRLLVVEDSLTTRTLIKSILETAGYEVQVAVDGQQAWDALPDANVDLVVSDVDMPRMDGFALTEAIRASKRFAQLPVVLVTARQSDEDQARGIRVGASAYLVKSGFDQRNLLETITQLV